jgi:AcrR family transcriptional regulator
MQVHYLPVRSNERQSGGLAASGDPTRDSTRDRLVTAAEALFADRGIAAVSLREINRAAGAKNTVAIQYHFGDRDGVVRAIAQKHWPDVNARRHAMLDDYESKSTDDLRALAAALVHPLAAKLGDQDGGPEYLQIYAELVNVRPKATQAEPAEVPTDSIQRWRLLVEPFLLEEGSRLHRRFTVIRFAAAELGRRASTAPHADDRLFVSDLVDLVAALLLAPTSAETSRLVAARDSSPNVRTR